MKSLLKTYFYLYILSLYCHCLFKDSSLLHHSRHYLQQSKYIHNKLFDSSATSIAQEPESPTLTTSGVVKTFFDTYTSSPGTSQYTDINKFQEFGSEIIKKSNVPNGKEEAWRSTNLKNLFSLPVHYNAESTITKASISKYIGVDCIHSHLVFIDGVFSTQFSDTSKIPTSVTASSISHLLSGSGQDRAQEALNSFLDVPDVHELKRDSFGSDILSGLTLTNFKDAAVILVPDEVDAKVPIQVVFMSSSSDKNGRASFPKLLARIGQNSTIEIRQTLVSESPESDTFVAGNTHVAVGSGARVIHTYSQELPLSARHVEVFSASVQQNAQYALTTVALGAGSSRFNMHVNLTGVGSNFTTNGALLGELKQALDLHSSIVHDTPSAVSRQQLRIVVAERGLGVFKGRIRIPKHAQETDSEQLCRSIMLGDKSRVIAMPTLEITADNIVCSHGASVTDVNPNSLFYIMSRGVDESSARKLLLKGFVWEVFVDYVYDESLLARIGAKLDSLGRSIESRKPGQTSEQNFVSM